MTAAHSALGASGAHRWMACPGSVAASKGLPNYTSEYAAEGTAAHALADGCYADHVRPEMRLGKIIPVSGFKIVVSEEMCEAVNVYLDAIAAIELGGGTAKTEVKFSLEKMYPGCFGTADYVHFNWDTRVLTVLDYKHGAGLPVEVKRNKQLMYYALGAMLEMNARSSTGQLPRKVVFGIVQPRCPHPDGPYRTDEIDAIDLMEFADDLVAAAKATEAKDAPLVPGSHCKFCPAAAVCPALSGVAHKAAAMVFSPATAAAYDPKMLAETLGKLEQIEAWCKSVREFAYNEAEAGKAIPGWKLVAKRATRKWLDAAIARTWLLARGFSKQDIITEPELRSPAQVEALLKARIKDRAFSEESVATLWEQFNPLAKAESSGHTLVVVADKRPAVSKVTAADVFAAA
jgi:hypothetical protein